MCVQCSASCGRGRRYRAVQCKYGDNNVLKSYCDSADEPESSIVCSSGPCPIWKTGIWGLVVIVSDIYFVLEQPYVALDLRSVAKQQRRLHSFVLTKY